MTQQQHTTRASTGRSNAAHIVVQPNRADELESADNRVRQHLAAAGLPPAAIKTVIAVFVNPDNKTLAALHELYTNLPPGTASHWLCEILAALANSLDPGYYAEELLTQHFDDLDEFDNLDRQVSEALCAATTKLVNVGLGMVLNDIQLRLAVLFLGALACQDPTSCPAAHEASSELLGDLLDLRT